ncbi:acetyltransferase [Novosphingobium sediminis]|uniref:Acetyltransferase n=1 Tax=Novosphingobium sediminis TaxID=707214 RepID=A0A512AFR5_9SPHN|nr:GNAT family N-acetyltransferase [Novosphingobium sediminis]GEN98516.1 acetyltransferase [Novosphingobium sediminis]
MTLPSGTDHIETERLLLRRMDERDLEFLIAVHADPEVARYLGTGIARTPAETEQWLADVLHGYATVNLGPLLVTRKIDGKRLGRSGLSDGVLEKHPQPGNLRRMWFFRTHVPEGMAYETLPELGYTFARENWGQGYASEAAQAVADYARRHLDHPAVMSVIHPGNVASRTVAQKFGVTYADDIEMGGRVYQRFLWPGFA